MHRILGQPRAIGALTAALRSGRVHHAWIFSGPKGVGKFTTAVRFARRLLDPDLSPPSEDETNTDHDTETSRLIDADTHPDLHIVRKELALFSANPELRSKKLLNIPLDLLRERILGGRTSDGRIHEAPAYRTPTLGHGKVFIIDEAELLGPEAQNALLKTLEEPPANTYIILVSSQPQRLFATIRSRCQHAAFSPLDSAAMNEWLDGADLDLDAQQRTWIELYSEGSPGTAQLAAQYGFHQWQVALTPMLADLAEGRYPAQMGQTLAELVESFASAWVDQHENASKDAANKDGAKHLLTMLAAHARRQLAQDAEHGDDPEHWLRVIDLLREAEWQLESHVNMKVLLENLVVQWTDLTAAPVRS